jgi:hypothetical protein
MAMIIALIWVSEKQKYFSLGGWTADLPDSPTRQISSPPRGDRASPNSLTPLDCASVEGWQARTIDPQRLIAKPAHALQ